MTDETGMTDNVVLSCKTVTKGSVSTLNVMKRHDMGRRYRKRIQIALDSPYAQLSGSRIF